MPGGGSPAASGMKPAGSGGSPAGDMMPAGGNPFLTNGPAPTMNVNAVIPAGGNSGAGGAGGAPGAGGAEGESNGELVNLIAELVNRSRGKSAEPRPIVVLPRQK